VGNPAQILMKVGINMFYGGIDVAKYRHEVCIVDEGGNVVLQIFVNNAKDGLNKLIHNLKRLEIEVSQIEFCLEATGHYWLGLYCHLTELGYKVHVINPIQSDALRNFYVRKTKTDRKDVNLLLTYLLALLTTLPTLLVHGWRLSI
jgi:transposase